MKSRKKQKIIFVIVSMAGGGAERVIAILANQFIKKGRAVAIMMTAGDDVAYRLDSQIELISMGGTSGGSMLARVERMKKMRKYFRKNPDATIISFGPGTSFFAVAASAFLKNPRIISERNDPKACEHPHLRNLVYSRGDYLVCQTQMAMREFPQFLQKKARVIENPITGDLPPRFQGTRTKRIVAVGRLEQQKNHRLLLEAFARFQIKHPDYRLHIYGKGGLEEELKTYAERLKIDAWVIWEGFKKNVLEEIRDASLYVLSSDFEGISNSLMEAMGLGLPVISTDCPIGGSRMCIENGENGILVPVGDVEAMYQAMCKLAEDSLLAEQMAEKAYEIRQKYSEENISRRWLEVVDSI